MLKLETKMTAISPVESRNEDGDVGKSRYGELERILREVVYDPLLVVAPRDTGISNDRTGP